MNYQAKRKRNPEAPEPHWLTTHRNDHSHDGNSFSQTLCVEAYEADLVLGKESLAITLEAPETNGTLVNSKASNTSPGTRGSGLIKWEGSTNDAVWVDRFDARLLLSELPSSCSPLKDNLENEPGSPISSSGWSDLPSDAEDTFFLSPSEVADVRRTKRQRVLEEARTQRLSALRAAGETGVDDDAEDGDIWDGSDEEPDAAQILLMERTAAHLHASPDRARLAARILTNHGADKRFAFMRGRWRRAWLRAQAKAAAAEEEEKRKATSSQLLSLGVYGDSDDESVTSKVKVSEKPGNGKEEETAKMEARRARAREWAARRRSEITGAVEGSLNHDTAIVNDSG